MSTTNVPLTDAEIASLLDGKVNDKAQRIVDDAKARLAVAADIGNVSPAIAKFVGDVVLEARNHGRLTYANERIRYCRVCDTAAGYAEYKSGPRRGTQNFAKPRTMPGIELAVRFVRTVGHVTLGCCATCMAEALPLIRAALDGERVDIPAALGARRWERHQNRRCTVCGWEGHEGEMGRLPTVLGDGTYAGTCPACSAENRFLSPVSVVLRDGFTLTAAQP